MNRHEGERLITTIRELMAEEGAASVRGDKARQQLREAGAEAGNGTPAKLTSKDLDRLTSDADLLERVYHLLKNRLIDELRLDPVFVQLLAVQRELEIVIEPRVITLDGATLRGRVGRLLAEGWFDQPKATGTTRRELARTGPDPGGGGSLSDVLSAFVKDGFLVRAGSDYERAAGLKVTKNIVEAR